MIWRRKRSEIFDLFYGELNAAPMIKDCPLNMECRLVEMVESSLNEIFIGEIVGTYTEEKYMTDGKSDFKKMKPLILSQAYLEGIVYSLPLRIPPLLFSYIWG